MLEPQLNTDMIRFIKLKETHKKITDMDEMDIQVKYAILESISNEMREIEINVSKFVKQQDSLLYSKI